MRIPRAASGRRPGASTCMVLVRRRVGDRARATAGVVREPLTSFLHSGAVFIPDIPATIPGISLIFIRNIPGRRSGRVGDSPGPRHQTGWRVALDGACSGYLGRSAGPLDPPWAPCAVSCRSGKYPKNAPQRATRHPAERVRPGRCPCWQARAGKPPRSAAGSSCVGPQRGAPGIFRPATPGGHSRISLIFQRNIPALGRWKGVGAARAGWIEPFGLAINEPGGLPRPGSRVVLLNAPTCATQTGAPP